MIFQVSTEQGVKRKTTSLDDADDAQIRKKAKKTQHDVGSFKTKRKDTRKSKDSNEKEKTSTVILSSIFRNNPDIPKVERLVKDTHFFILN